MKINNFQGELTDVSVVKEALAAGGDAGHRDDGQGDRKRLSPGCCRQCFCFQSLIQYLLHTLIPQKKKSNENN